MKTVFEIGSPGRRACRLGEADGSLPAPETLVPADCLRARPPRLPEVGELDLVRHYTRLSQRNFAITTHFYPLGSCTMKYNPVINEREAAREGFTFVHPLQDAEDCQGTLDLARRLERMLAEISGLDAISLHPAAGAQGELCSLLVLKAWLGSRDDLRRDTILIPDSAHGTNPASCAIAGFGVETVPSDERGLTDLASLEATLERLGSRVAGLMITNPNTLGLFEERIGEITRAVHDAGGLVYMDGANLNAILGVTRPGDFGVDMMHFNLHKTMSTPHGGGGPGSGPIGVRKELERFLPVPRIVQDTDGPDGRFRLSYDAPDSIGSLRGFFANVGMLVRAYVYLRAVGSEGLRRIAENAVLNANYLRKRIGERYRVPYDRLCMHEFVADARAFKEHGLRALDIAKRLLDKGHHAPTIYFPLIVPEALMIEPTETESKETLDAFVDAMFEIDDEARRDPELLLRAPHDLGYSRFDEVRAVKEPVLREDLDALEA